MELRGSLTTTVWLLLILVSKVTGNGNCEGGIKCLGEKGEQGPTGWEGSRGPKGHTGHPGMRGPPGPVGLDGFPGDIGDPGDAGFSGARGPAGQPGPPGLPGDDGDHGAVGMPGPAGPAGSPGPKGNPGESGYQGLEGPPGYMGKSGEPGPDGFDGFPGNKGSQGFAGPPGEPGCKGHPGNCLITDTAAAFSFLVKHSQTDVTPNCPSGSTLLWHGYSLLYTEDDGRTTVQNLGTTGSCLKEFNPMPFMFCNNEDKCDYAGRTGNSYWLSNVNRTPRMSPINNSELYGYISRCVVCFTTRSVVTTYSVDNTVPSCPPSTELLWTGYKFLMHLTGAGGGGNHMTGSGACLMQFSFHPYIECGSHGTCHYFSDQHAYWVIRRQTGRSPAVRGHSLSTSFFGSEARDEVIRCSVCHWRS